MHKARVFPLSGINQCWKNISSIQGSCHKRESGYLQKKYMSELKIGEARKWLESVRKAGLPIYRESLTDYYERFSFTLTPLIVILISTAIGGRFKKNVLLMSLSTSLSISVLYYVLEMVLVLFAKQGYIQPIAGAWGTFFLFLGISLVMFKSART